MEDKRIIANSYYANFQIAKALITADTHTDPAARAKALKKISTWQRVLEGMAKGELSIGSRTPVANTPGWVTLEVAMGGFATGNKLAGGPLHGHERQKASQIAKVNDEHVRKVLNLHFLSDAGLAELQVRLKSGNYRIEVPEEAALMIVAWLAREGRGDAARELVDVILPHFNDLRFYPTPSETSIDLGARVAVRNVGEVVRMLREKEPNHNIMAQKEAIEIWTPFYDRLVSLFLETVDGDAPTLTNKTLSAGQTIAGGWPCSLFPADWKNRSVALLNEIARHANGQMLCGGWHRKRHPFALLRQLLEKCVANPDSLTGREVGRIRLILAGYVCKRGTPGSHLHRFRRHQQAQQNTTPHHILSKVIAERLSKVPSDAGLESPNEFLGPLTAAEATAWQIPAGGMLPSSLNRKVEFCLEADVATLAEKHIIGSGEVLAKLLPRIVGVLRAESMRSPDLRRLYAAVYRAFRRRRSLLLLNYQSQIRIEELPWVAIMEQERAADNKVLAKEALVELAVMTLTSFPHTIVPNKLLKEFHALSRESQLDLPLVDELAADIFMGGFGAKFLRAAKVAAEMLEGSLYSRYYGIDFREINSMKIEEGMDKQEPVISKEFGEWCARRAGESKGRGWVAANGKIIEQQQIVTTQNLAVLVGGLGLRSLVEIRGEQMIMRCFTWICRRLQMKLPGNHAQLIVLKNSAYAWRQMIFYLSLLPPKKLPALVASLEETLSKQRFPFRSRLQPVIAGLRDAIHGTTTTSRQFLGWTTDRHWLAV